MVAHLARGAATVAEWQQPVAGSPSAVVRPPTVLQVAGLAAARPPSPNGEQPVAGSLIGAVVRPPTVLQGAGLAGRVRVAPSRPGRRTRAILPESAARSSRCTGYARIVATGPVPGGAGPAEEGD